MMQKAVRLSHSCIQLNKNCKRYTQINTINLKELPPLPQPTEFNLRYSSQDNLNIRNNS